MRIAVIGSGVSGLTAAALLAQSDHHVVVYEQSETIGGVTAGIEKGGYRWDLGQMLLPDLGPGEPGRLILERLGVSDQVTLIRSWRGNVFPEFEIWRPDELRDPDWRRNLLKKTFPGDCAGLDRYYSLYERIHDLSALKSRKGLAAKLKMLRKYLPIRHMKGWSTRVLLDSLFTDHRLKAVFSAILADYVTGLDVFPGLIIPIINAEHQYDERLPLDHAGREHHSSWGFIGGGCAQLVSALAVAARREGAEIRCSAEVARILVEEGRVSGLRLADGSTERVDAIVASGGARELFLGLVGAEHVPADFLAAHVNDLATTESVFMVHLGVDYDAAALQHGAALCYYYLSYDIDGAIRECEERVFHEGRHGYLVYIPSVHSPHMAPSGHQAVTIYTIAPNEPVNGSWRADKERWADVLLMLAEKRIPGLRAHMRTRIVLTPEDFRVRTHLAHHAFGGCPPRLDRSPPPHRTPIGGLWFIGAQSEAYGGVTAGMVSAQKTVAMLSRQRA